MKTTLRNLVFAASLFSAGNTFAQPGFTEKVTSFSENGSGNSGSDFWFAPIQNDTDVYSKYIALYISSLANGKAYIECNRNRDSVIVGANAISTFYLPLSWELKSSGVVENKAIHVWSVGPGLSVYLMSHRPNYGDGMCCIRTQDLGNDYVVAGFNSLFESSGSYDDYPSEFTISAIRDSTIVEITPSTDLRHDSTYIGYTGFDTSIAFARGKKFSVMLNHGQSIQYQAVYVKDDSDYDVTGTVIHSSNPVAVVGGSMASEVPAGGNGAANYLCDIIPPIASWGKTYYTTGTEGNSSNQNTCCIISSVPNQTIYNYNTIFKQSVVVTLGPAYAHYYAEADSAERWFSDEPFMLVQYLNSSSFPTQGPAMAIVNPKENFAKTIIFTTPADQGGITDQFDNYVDITVNLKDTNNVTLDGRKITLYPRLLIDSTYYIFLAAVNFQQGGHIVTSDSGVGVFVYGYGSQSDAYAFSGSLGKSVLNDSIPPIIAFAQDSTCANIWISDSGTGISEIVVDSMSNISFLVDNGFKSGAGAMQSFANLCVVDSLKIGYLQITALDLAGNRSTETIEYTKPLLSHPGFAAQTISYDTVLVGTDKTLPIFTVTDTSTVYPITIDKIWTESSEFIFEDNLAENGLPMTLTPLTSHSFFIIFRPDRDSIYSTPAFAQSYELPDVRVDTLTGIGYSVVPAAVVDEARAEAHATLTPNPAAKSVALDFSLSQTADVTFELSSMDGKTAFTWNANNESEREHIQTLDISSLSSGSYIYRFSANGQATSGKLVIIR